MTTVVLLGTLDTKGREYEFVKGCLDEAGVDSILVDFGVLSDPDVKPDISAHEVARYGGANLDDLRFTREDSETRSTALATMTRVRSPS